MNVYYYAERDEVFIADPTRVYYDKGNEDHAISYKFEYSGGVFFFPALLVLSVEDRGKLVYIGEF